MWRISGVGEGAKPFDYEDFSVSEELEELSMTDDHSRTILHFDIDCFYAQVEMLNNPSLRGKPVGIHQKDLVVTCNYEARRLGVTKCSYISQARKVCPSLVLVNGEDLAEYRRYSQKIFEFLRGEGKGVCSVERSGMDENFMDVTNLVREMVREDDVVGFVCGNKPIDSGDDRCEVLHNCFCVGRLKIGSKIARDIRQKIFDSFGITTSGGIAHNKLMCKLAGNLNKPNKQTTVFPTGARELMLSLKTVKGIPGIGPSTYNQLKAGSENDVSTEEVRSWSIQQLSDRLNHDVELAKRIKLLCCGIDHSLVKNSNEKPLSMGLEDRFVPLVEWQQVEDKMKCLLDRLCILLHEDGRQPQTIKVTLRDLLKDRATGVKDKFHKESRQAKVNPRLFSSLKTDSSLKSEDRLEVLKLSMTLLGKMICVKGPMQLTLLGLSVTDFLSAKGNISSFFLVRTTSNSKEASEPPTGKGRRGDDDDDQTPIGAQREILLSSRSFENSTSEATKRRRSDDDAKMVNGLPDDWDPEVFAALPDDVKSELISSPKSEFPVMKSKRKKMNNSITNYFVKS